MFCSTSNDLLTVSVWQSESCRQKVTGLYSHLSHSLYFWYYEKLNRCDIALVLGSSIRNWIHRDQLSLKAVCDHRSRTTPCDFPHDAQPGVASLKMYVRLTLWRTCVSAFPSRWASIHSVDSRYAAENWIFLFIKKFPEYSCDHYFNLISFIATGAAHFMSQRIKHAFPQSILDSSKIICSLNAAQHELLVRISSLCQACHVFKLLWLTHECKWDCIQTV